MTSSRVTNTAPNYRIRPSVGAGIGILVAYLAVFLVVGGTSGIGYGEWFDTAANVWRAAVAGLAAGTVLLVAFLYWARWDMIWRDPARLPMPPLLWVVPALFVLLALVRYATVGWGEVPGGLILACVVAGVLVGFNEEMLLRGFFLRSVRTGGRSEGMAVLWTCVAFGLLHLPNVFLGTGLPGLTQVVTAGLSGVAFYLFRRGFGVIVAAMAAHGFWDLSLFLPSGGGGIADYVSIVGTLVVTVLALVILVVIVRRDRDIAVTPEGVVPAGEPAPRVR